VRTGELDEHTIGILEEIDSSEEQEKQEEPVKAIYVIGCGRSGTTMVFEHIVSSLKAKADKVLAMNEPRALFLNNQKGFDVWSKKAFDQREESDSFDIDE
jgi:hypothetical protein